MIRVLVVPVPDIPYSTRYGYYSSIKLPFQPSHFHRKYRISTVEWQTKLGLNQSKYCIPLFGLSPVYLGSEKVGGRSGARHAPCPPRGKSASQLHSLHRTGCQPGRLCCGVSRQSSNRTVSRCSRKSRRGAGPAFQRLLCTGLLPECY